MNENVLVLNEQNMKVPTKAEISVAAAKLVERVDEGYMNPLPAYGQLTALEEAIKAAKERIKEPALDEAERYGQKTFAAYGCEYQVKETGVKYDYSQNAHWRELKETLDLAAAELKGYETTLKQMGLCSKTSTTSVSVTLKKQ